MLAWALLAQICWPGLRRSLPLTPKCCVDIPYQSSLWVLWNVLLLHSIKHTQPFRQKPQKTAESHAVYRVGQKIRSLCHRKFQLFDKNLLLKTKIYWPNTEIFSFKMLSQCLLGVTVWMLYASILLYDLGFLATFFIIHQFLPSCWRQGCIIVPGHGA